MITGRHRVPKNLRIEITSEYPFNFPQEMENVTYTLVFVNDHDGNSMSPGHYLCDILYFNTGIQWRCNNDIITQLREITENVYIVAPYTTAGNKVKKCDERF